MEDWPEDEQSNYRGTEYIGKLGVEQSFEQTLHGVTGVEQVETSAGGRAVRKLASTPATPGNTVKLSLDIKLQKLVEDLYGDRRGAMVALDPKTGEILAFVSKPTFDPNLFVDGIDQENWALLNESIDKPLLNRALRGTYPPGSTFKPFMALAALETGKRGRAGDQRPGLLLVRQPPVPRRQAGRPRRDRHVPVDRAVERHLLLHAGQRHGRGPDPRPAVALRLRRDHRHRHPGRVRGLLPSTEWKRKAYKKPEQQKWYAGETISLGIGQGYNNFTMLQAQAASIVADGGVRHRPHVVLATRDTVTGKIKSVIQPPAEDLGFKPANVAVVREGLVSVVTSGTARGVFAGAGYQAAGKTGTAQAVTQAQNTKYNAKALEEHQRDHALFMGFAPANDPKIALAVIVENAGWGAGAAAPIARRVMDYWLMDQYPSEADMAAIRVGKATAPIGKPRVASEVAWPPVPATTPATAP
jgi:penicillin-binding protein 2